MAAPAFIGDELTGAGFRLAGARVFVPEPSEGAGALGRARAEADIILITADCARRIDRSVLREALMAAHPMVVVVPDAASAVAPPDIAAQLRSALGIDS